MSAARILAGLPPLGSLLGKASPLPPAEPTCEAWAADDGCIGDSNGVSCSLPPDHNGMHWDKNVKVFWYPAPVAP